MRNRKYSHGVKNIVHRDEYYTPKVLVEIIIEFIPKNKIIWCPFDTIDSEFVTTLIEYGYQVKYSHIVDGQDFFKYQPDKWDIAISNPPYSTKNEVFKRLKKLDKPFAMTMPITSLNYIWVQNYFRTELPDIQFLFQNSRMSFDGNTPSFTTMYVCRKFLPKSIIFKKVRNNNTGKNYVPSRMEKDRARIRKYWEKKESK